MPWRSYLLGDQVLPRGDAARADRVARARTLQRTQLTLAEGLALGRRVASALSAVHRSGVVHRDIKPSNLFLRDNAIDRVVLIDFGMARRPLADPKLTVTGTMLGTPGYIAPEQVYNVPNLDGRVDIFSLITKGWSGTA